MSQFTDEGRISEYTETQPQPLQIPEAPPPENVNLEPGQILITLRNFKAGDKKLTVYNNTTVEELKQHYNGKNVRMVYMGKEMKTGTL